MYSIEFTKKASQQFAKLDRIVQERVSDVLERIKFRPFSFVKRKQGTLYYILRAGFYRIILEIKNESLLILVLELGHRKNIYK